MALSWMKFLRNNLPAFEEMGGVRVVNRLYDSFEMLGKLR